MLITRHISKFIVAHNLGQEFASKNKGIVTKGKTRYYLDNTKIDKKLPDAYQFGVLLDEKPELCTNCKFYIITKTGEEYCAAWDANVKGDYWCKKWQKNQSK